ncbi:MAG: Crp/Fnr family transcriptional regulator [Limisphaerales bacterium]
MPLSTAELKEAALIQALRTAKLFVGLSNEDLRRIAGMVTPRDLDTNEYLFREGEPSKGFYIVRSGALCVHRVNAVGKEQVIHVFRPGESLAEATLTMEQGYPANARALQPTQILLIRKDGFVEMLRQHPELALRMLASMAVHLHVLVGQIEDLTLKDVETRLANWFLKQCPRPIGSSPFSIHLKGTKRALAAELGTVSETFSRTLAKFRDLQLVEVDGPSITLLNPRKLEELLRHNLGE